ncbi:hypothetical protein ABZT50_33345, partial [Streptomyces sp. NPDC005505]
MTLTRLPDGPGHATRTGPPFGGRNPPTGPPGSPAERARPQHQGTCHTRLLRTGPTPPGSPAERARPQRQGTCRTRLLRT